MNNFCDTHKRYCELKKVFDLEISNLDLQKFIKTTDDLLKYIEKNEVVLDCTIKDQLLEHTDIVYCVAIEYDSSTVLGMIVSGSSDKTALVYFIKEGKID